jgi:hypothetical protein
MKKRYSSFQSKDAHRKSPKRYMRMLCFAGYPEEYDGSEDDLPDWVEALTGIPADDTRKMTRLVAEAAFGPGTPSPEQEIYVRLVYRRTADGVYRRIKTRKKLVFRYWKAFG